MGTISTFCILVFCTAQCISCEEVQVQVEQGLLSGERLTTVIDDKQYYSFKGIPYAKAPIGKLRFMEPQPPDTWEGVRNATAHGSVCPQADMLNNVLIPGSEDCLFLNVYSPNLKPETPLPVMFFIHGGGFKFGSGNDDIYGPDFLVSKDVVVVTINYRLDALGFLCLGIKEVPGNAGLKDQVFALKWVRKNIMNFGGDADNITIFGESAGATAVGYHLISPMSKGLFKRAILESGVPEMDVFLSFKPVERAFVLGKELGFNTKNASELLILLQNVTSIDLVNKTATVFASEEITHIFFKATPFTPVIEKDLGHERFVTEDTYVSLARGNVNNADVMFSYNTYETLVMIPYYAGVDLQYIQRYARFIELMVPLKILIKSPPELIYSLANEIIQHYFGSKNISIDNMPEFIKYSSFASLVYDVHRFARRWPKVGNTFLMKFNSFSSRNYYGSLGAPYGLKGASHFDDLLYIFHPKSLNLTLTTDSREYALVQQLTTVFTNFAKYGNPTPDSSLNVEWPQFDNSSLAYVDVGDNLTVRYAPDEEDIQFWKYILKCGDITF